MCLFLCHQSPRALTSRITPLLYQISEKTSNLNNILFKLGSSSMRNRTQFMQYKQYNTSQYVSNGGTFFQIFTLKRNCYYCVMNLILPSSKKSFSVHLFVAEVQLNHTRPELISIMLSFEIRKIFYNNNGYHIACSCSANLTVYFLKRHRGGKIIQSRRQIIGDWIFFSSAINSRLFAANHKYLLKSCRWRVDVGGREVPPSLRRNRKYPSKVVYRTPTEFYRGILRLSGLPRGFSFSVENTVINFTRLRVYWGRGEGTAFFFFGRYYYYYFFLFHIVNRGEKGEKKSRWSSWQICEGCCLLILGSVMR